jgi:hypothetical protein
MSESDNTPVPWLKPGRYVHFKGGQYQVLSVATHSETGESVVVYQALYGERGWWVRPLSQFSETVNRDGVLIPRFTRLSD